MVNLEKKVTEGIIPQKRDWLEEKGVGPREIKKFNREMKYRRLTAA